MITPARNEEAFVGETIESVLRQTVRPERWVIIDDGSTDRTADIVAEYTTGNPWIELIRLPHRQERHFAGKIHAFNVGFERVKSLEFQLLANLDADVSLQPDHFEFLIRKFSEDARLGVAGTAYTQPGFYSATDSFEGEESVAGPLQLFRYECFRDIGGYTPNRLGGVDWIAVTTARMKGWKTRNFRDRCFHHQRSMGTAGRNAVTAMFFHGWKDYLLGSGPLWELFRVVYRITKRPLLFGGLALGAGYGWAAIRRVPRPVSAELVRFYRLEQSRKLKRIIGSVLRLQKVEKFYLDKQSNP